MISKVDFQYFRRNLPAVQSHEVLNLTAEQNAMLAHIIKRELNQNDLCLTILF